MIIRRKGNCHHRVGLVEIEKETEKELSKEKKEKLKI